MTLQQITTKDGSHSLLVKELNETYHSRNGALAEANHVFIKNGLEEAVARCEKNIAVLEIGFGTGLNTFLTALYAGGHNLSITYHALENYPLNWETISKLNYASEKEFSVFEKIHRSLWGKETSIIPNFRLKKIEDSVFNFTPPLNYDLIYFDAFARRPIEPLYRKANIF